MARILKITAIMGLLALCGSAWAVDANDPNLVAHWKFDEESGTTAYDSAGSNDGTLVNGPAWTTGQINGALEFDGTNDYVTVTDDSSLDISGAISFSAWIRLNNLNWQIIISKRGPDGWYPHGGYTFHFQNSDVTGYVFRLMFTKTNGIGGSGGGKYGTNKNWDRIVSEKSGNDWQAGVWYHVAATWDGTTDTNSMKMYIDGQLDATHTAKQSFILTNNYDLKIGNIVPGMSDPFNGIMDDVRIYERALSADEVYELYFMGLPAHERAVMKLENAAGKKQAALEIIEEALDEEGDAYGALEEMLEGKDYGDLNKRDIIRARQEIHSAMQRQEQAGGALEGSIEGLYDALTGLGWEPNLIAHWKLDEGTGTVAYDSAGSNHGTLVNGPAWTTGKIDGGLDFDGINDYVDVGDPADGSLDFGASDSFTLSLWFKRASTGGEHTFIYKKKVVGGTHYEGYAWKIYLDNLYFGIEDTSNHGVDITGSTAITDSEWHHAVAVRDVSKDKIYLYLDGVSDATPIEDTTAGTLETTFDFWIGRWHTYDSYFNGVIDDVRVYDKALTAGEILQLYEEGL